MNPTPEQRTAIETQRRYFDKWEQKISQGEHFQFERNDLHIQTAHRLLIQSYNKLIKLYPNSSAQNRQAFYDHLCALDFI